MSSPLCRTDQKCFIRCAAEGCCYSVCDGIVLAFGFGSRLWTVMWRTVSATQASRRARVRTCRGKCETEDRSADINEWWCRPCILSSLLYRGVAFVMIRAGETIASQHGAGCESEQAGATPRSKSHSRPHRREADEGRYGTADPAQQLQLLRGQLSPIATARRADQASLGGPIGDREGHVGPPSSEGAGRPLEPVRRRTTPSANEG